MPPKGYKATEETKEKLRLSHLGQVPWNKGRVNVFSEETKEKMRLAHLGKYCGEDNPFYGKHHTKRIREIISKTHLGHIPWNKGKPQTEEAKEKNRLAHLGHIAWNKGKKLEQISWAKGKHWLEEVKIKMSLAHLGKIPWNKGKRGLYKTSLETKKKISEAGKGRRPTKEAIRNMLRRRIPTSLEEKFQSIVDKYNLPYKYVGDGSFIIGTYNPDFINTNSEKIAIEVYARYYKERNNISIKDWKIKRSNVFRQYGWQIMYFNEIEVNEENILNKLNEVKI